MHKIKEQRNLEVNKRSLTFCASVESTRRAVSGLREAIVGIPAPVSCLVTSLLRQQEDYHHRPPPPPHPHHQHHQRSLRT